jgi:hypothetical protein
VEARRQQFWYATFLSMVDPVQFTRHVGLEAACKVQASFRRRGVRSVVCGWWHVHAWYLLLFVLLLGVLL